MSALPKTYGDTNVVLLLGTIARPPETWRNRGRDLANVLLETETPNLQGHRRKRAVTIRLEGYMAEAAADWRAGDRLSVQGYLDPSHGGGHRVVARDLQHTAAADHLIATIHQLIEDHGPTAVEAAVSNPRGT